MKNLSALLFCVTILIVSCNPNKDPDIGNARSSFGDAGTLRLTIEAQKSAPGFLAPLAGISLRDPSATDFNGNTIQLSAFAQQWNAMPVSMVRHPAGTQSYNITSVQDANVAYTQTITIPQMLESPTNDFTWPPQLDINDVDEWVTANTGRISLANEPPNHTPELWANGTEYAEWAESVYEANPNLQSKMWIQSGKPEVAKYFSLQSQRIEHQQILSATAFFVSQGRLPARIITTHKISPDQPADYQSFYEEIIQDYKDYFGSNVQVCFQEWNYRDNDSLTAEAFSSSGAFLINLARLKYDNPTVISGAAYHQGHAVGGTHIVGLTSANNGTWFTNGFTTWWQDFVGLVYWGAYVNSTVLNKPATVDLAVIENAGKKYILFANRSGAIVPFPNNAASMTYWGEDMTKLSGSYSNALPANSSGYIELRTSRRSWWQRLFNRQ